MSCEGTNIFSAGAGRVIALEDESATPITFTVDSSSNTINNLSAIVTSVGIQGQGGYQFMHAMRELIYVYIFNERIGEIVVNGLAFPAACSPIGPDADEDFECTDVTSGAYGTTGLQRVITWYECNRITTRASPITISFGAGVSYDAFLVAMKADIANADTGIAQFSYRFNYVPRITDDDSICFTTSESCTQEACTEIVPVVDTTHTTDCYVADAE